MIPLGNNQTAGTLWHCFGVKDEVVDEWTALEMLAASRTRILPINCHALDSKGPIVGHGTLTYERLKRKPLLNRVVPCLNINLQTRVENVVKIARRAREMTGIDLLKLEVLTPDLLNSDDGRVLRATDYLSREDFRVMPLLSANLEMAARLANLDNVPVLRVMGSPIGSGQGILDPDTLEQIVELGLPVVLDGGIGRIEQAIEALDLGCAGFLVNSCLFKHVRGPAEALRDFRLALDRLPV